MKNIGIKLKKKIPKKVIKILANKKIYQIFWVIEIILILIYLLLIYFTNNYAINTTPSVKLGVYRIYKMKENESINKGDLVVYKIPKEIQQLSTLKDTDIPSLKPVAAVYGDKIEIINSHIYVNGEDFGVIIKNKKLPHFDGQLKEDEVLTLSKVENTLDGRYYGGIKKNKIKWKAKLVYEIKK